MIRLTPDATKRSSSRREPALTLNPNSEAETANLRSSYEFGTEESRKFSVRALLPQALAISAD
jgi:hypothetical protein